MSQQFDVVSFNISSIEDIQNSINIQDTGMDEIEKRIEADPEPRIFTWYINFQFWKPGPFIVVISWFCVILLGVFYGFDILNLTVFTFSAPAGTPGDTADKKMKSMFKDREESRQILLYYECPSCEQDGNPAIELLTDSSNPNSTDYIMKNMSLVMLSWLLDQGSIFQSMDDFYSTASLYNGTNQEMQILASLIYISRDGSNANKSAIGIINYDNTADQQKKDDLLDNTNDKCDDITTQHGKDLIKLTMTGESALVKAMNEESRKDVEKKDTLTIPLALCVLALIIRSWRLMFIPLLTFGTSICASFSIMRPFAEYVLDVNPFCPSIMMSVTIAMSIDYSLFLLSRYREEIERKHVDYSDRASVIRISRNAIRQTTRWSGKVIALSGCILSITYFSLVFYPMQVLQSVGLGAGLAIIMTILVNLTLTPAILLIFPYFFSKFGWAGCPCQKMKCCNRGDGKGFCADHKEPLIGNNTSINVNVDNIDDDDYHSHDNRVNNPYNDSMIEVVDLRVNVNENDPCEKFWFLCGSKTTVCPWSILIMIFVYAAIAPIGWQFLQFKEQLADTLIFPRDSPYLATYNDVVRDFSAGYVAPWSILIFAKENQTVNIDPYTSTHGQYKDMSYLTETGLIINETLYKCFDSGYYVTMEGVGFLGGAYEFPSVNDTNETYGINGQPLDLKTQLFLYGPNPQATQMKQVYQYIVNSKISTDTKATYYGMTSSFDPYYEHAIDFVDDFRDYLSDACDKYGYNGLCYVTGGSIDEVDSVKKIYSNFGTVLGIIVAVIFSLMGIVFKSTFVPFRLFITIAVPMTFVYGLAIMVYQNGMLNGLNVEALANTDGLYWLIPVMTVTILIGLALDYDIFLFARIYEYRIMGGVPTHEAIVRGVYKTGSIITAAGLIMGIAFCGLLLSKITSLNQTGFIMVVAVLVDTFIIRTSLVPAVLSIAKEVNWWPGLNPKCLPNPDSDQIPMNPSSAHSINAVKPLRTGNLNIEPTLDDIM